MNRLVLASGTVLVFAFVAAMQGCSSSDSGTGGSGNAPSAGTGNTTGGARATTGGTSAATTGGTSAGGTSAATTGGTSAGGASSGTTGGASAGGAAAGGTSSGGTGGTSAGGTAAGGGGTVMLCAAGETKMMPCTTATPEGMSCNKTCGITALGSVKAETCGGGMYTEGACTYPAAGDYTCYKKPAAPVACAGADTVATGTMGVMGYTAVGYIHSGAACTVPDCAPCGPYIDGSNKNKDGGLCVCKMGTGGTSKWTCASATEWPPQAP